MTKFQKGDIVNALVSTGHIVIGRIVSFDDHFVTIENKAGVKHPTVLSMIKMATDEEIQFFNKV